MASTSTTEEIRENEIARFQELKHELRQRYGTERSPDNGSALSRKATEELSLMELYHKATAIKMYDVEELPDYYFHRRIAAVGATIIYKLPITITPNQVTLLALIIGWLAAFFSYEAYFQKLIVPNIMSPTVSSYLAALMLMMWDVTDCCDGQVARLCRNGTRTGRIVDGTVDMLVLVPIFTVYWWIVNEVHGTWWGLAAALGGVSLIAHAGLYDNVKNVYMTATCEKAETDGETPDKVYKEFKDELKKSKENGEGWTFDCFLLWVYNKYLLYQSFLGGGEKSHPKEELKARTPKGRKEYQRKYWWIMRLASFIGIGSHVTSMYITWLVAPTYPVALKGLTVFLAGFLNLLHVVVLFLYHSSGMTENEKD